MILVWVWIISMVAAIILASEKKQNMFLYLLIASITGPLAVIILLLISPQRGAGPDVAHGLPGLNTNEDIRRELFNLRASVKDISDRISFLESKVTFNSDSREVAPVSAQSNASPAMEGSLENALSDKEKVLQAAVIKPVDMEMYFGRNWLSKIGIVVFTLGMVFLISYTFKYFGPLVKVLFGYLVSIVFFVGGKKLEHNEKFLKFGRVIWGGGWAIAYFTTYAMHHFKASRLMEDPYLNLLLLALLVVGLLVYVVKYKNEDMMAIALLAAYVAATMGQVTNFTLLSCLLLAGVVLFLVYKFQWIKTLGLGIILTYGIHQYWVMPHIVSLGGQILWWKVADTQFAQLLNLTFLTGYAVVFLAAAHVARTGNDESIEKTVGVINFGNVAFYSVMAFSLVNEFFYSKRFEIVLFTGVLFLALALLARRLNRRRLFESDLVAGIFMLTFAVPLRFMVLSSLLIWTIEIPFLLFVGLRFKERIYTYISYVLTGYLSLRMVDAWGLGSINVFGIAMAGRDFIYLCAGLAMGLCFYLLYSSKEKTGRLQVDYVFEHLFPVASCFYFTALLFSFVKDPWISLGLALEAVGLLVLSAVLGLKRFRVYAYLSLIVSGFVFIFERFYMSAGLVQWSIIVGNLLIYWGFYYAVKSMRQVKFLLEVFVQEDMFLFCAAVLLLTVTIFNHFAGQFISLSLGVAGALLIISGIWRKDRVERLGGLALLGVTLCRVAFVDLSGLDVIYKIITFIVLGLLFLGASYVYNRFGIDKQ